VKTRLDVELARRGLATSRSQAENAIRLGQVEVDGRVATKAGQPVQSDSAIRLLSTEQYVSRAGLKLASVASGFKVEFQGKTVLDIGSSTGGFTDYALQHGAERVIAVDVGTDQLHPSLRADERVELYEKTDIRDFQTDQPIDIIVCDVSFISLREILPHVARALMGSQTVLLAMVKPQFEAGKGQVNKGVIKNDKIRRQILAGFEEWARNYFVVQDKRDSDVAGQKGNVERFYVLKKAK
jgi:23S rRNA (cytidine1920-2'-O)/16S rRNA (cytidine1409-2'-O)-methyltransferase